jgi:hypothetical protein
MSSRTNFVSRITAFALATLPLAVACDTSLTKPSLYNTVRVVVTQRNGTGIPGAGLVLYTGHRHMGYGATDSSGAFTFTRVPQGVYGVTATPPDNYALMETLVRVPRSNTFDELLVQGDTLKPVRFTFLKRGPGVVVVRVTQTTGAPLAGVSVTLYDPSAIRGTGRTDATGSVVFNAVPFGVYGVSVARPFLYRDFRTFGDSAGAYRDDLIVDAGSRDSVSFVFTKCAGSIRLRAVDQNGAPVPGSTAVVYTSTAELAGQQTGTDGRATFVDVPCVTQVGVRITAPAGYSVAQGRGSSFVDGLTFGVGQVIDLNFQLVKSP